MISTFEISLYPLQEDYKSTIKTFIKKLYGYEELDVKTTEMSTYITGDFQEVMSILSTELSAVYEKVPSSSTVIKIIPMNLGVSKGFINDMI